MTLHIAQDEAADEVLSTSPFALLIGMLLLQQVPIETAFAGPAQILTRFGSLDPESIAQAEPDKLAELFATDPAIHPYPESMSVLVQAAARQVVAHYGGDAAALWQTATSGKQLLNRLTALPGFSKRKAQILIALLGKQQGIRPDGWEKAAGRFGRPDTHLSVADVRDRASLDRVASRSSQSDDGDEWTDDDQPVGETDRDDSDKDVVNVSNEQDQVEQSDPTEPTPQSGEGEQTGRMQRGGGGGAKKGERGGGAKKAARKAARQAARREAAQEAETSSDESAEQESGGGRGRGAAKKAAKKAAKRAARRASKGLDTEPSGGTGPGRGGQGKKGAAKRNARKRAAAEQEGTDESLGTGTDSSSVVGDDLAAEED